MLRRYRSKRDFDVSAEPQGATKRAAKQPSKKLPSFVIQKHAATRLHYDLRLEIDGVMKSWAVTRGPSLAPTEKRLAIHVEDHPIEYNTFENTIPKGQYGGGTVMIWDRGVWLPEFDARSGYAKGHLSFELQGEKLHGAWHLVKMRKRPGERQDPWLLIKVDDEFARAPNDPDILEEQPLSVVTGRSLDEIAAGKKPKRKIRGKVAAKSKAKTTRSSKNAKSGAKKASVPRKRARGARKRAVAKNRIS